MTKSAELYVRRRSRRKVSHGEVVAGIVVREVRKKGKQSAPSPDWLAAMSRQFPKGKRVTIENRKWVIKGRTPKGEVILESRGERKIVTQQFLFEYLTR